MNTAKEYDVLRLIEHNQICYVSADSKKGCSLAEWIKSHPYISKDKLFQWIREMLCQLIRIHKCRGNPSYLYVNPFCLIVTEDDNLCFLDVHAESNEEIIDKIQRRDIREFFQTDNTGRTGEEVDLYGFGKTVQYLVNFMEVVPGFTKIEERNLHKIIAGCTCTDVKKRFHSFFELRRMLCVKIQT